MKKIISALLSVVMMMSVFSVGAYAAGGKSGNDEIMPMYSNSDVINSSLSIKNKTAQCKTTVTLASNEKWVKVTQTLQKQSASGNWSEVNTWSKSATSDSAYCTFTNSMTLNSTGKYRVKSTIVVSNSNGQQEDIIVYSNVVSL